MKFGTNNCFNRKEVKMEEYKGYSVLESLVILFDKESDYDRINEVLQQWKHWTLEDIFNYYIIEEQTNKVLEIKEIQDNNTLQIKTGQFEF